VINRLSNLLLAFLNASTNDESSEHIIAPAGRLIISWTIKFGVSVAALYYIVSRILNEGLAVDFIFNAVRETSKISIASLALFSILLASLNWGLEMYKWNMLIKPQLGTHWRTSVKGVLTGTTFGILSPNRIGEFVGRILALGPSQRVSGALLSFVNSCAQSMATLTFGIVGFMFLIEEFGIEAMGSLASRMIQVLLIMLWATSLFIYFKLPALSKMKSSRKAFDRIQKYLSVFDSLDFRLLNRLYILSMIRFVSFLGQYFLVFGFIIDDPNWIAIGGLAAVTLFTSTVLSFVPIPDIMLREALALSYFGFFGFNLVEVSIGVFLVWFINVAMPAVVGSIVLFSYRIFKSA